MKKTKIKIHLKGLSNTLEKEMDNIDSIDEYLNKGYWDTDPYSPIEKELENDTKSIINKENYNVYNFVSN